MILTAFAVHLAIAAPPPEPPPLAVPTETRSSSSRLCQRSTPRRPPPRPPRRGRRHLRLGPGGLRAHENSLGHCCRKHIGRTPEQLRARLKRERKRTVSSFYTLRKAQTALKVALRRNYGRINDWLATPRHVRFPILEIRVRMSTHVGIYLRRGMKRPRAGRTAIFILRDNEYWPGNFQIVTMMVER